VTTFALIHGGGDAVALSRPKELASLLVSYLPEDP
jgi:hypothetical protein